MAKEKKRRASKHSDGHKPEPVDTNDKATEEQESGEEHAGEAPTLRGETERKEEDKGASCPVVGVGASAGGLEALQGLFGNLPQDLKVAFVVIQHRAGDETSIMQSLLERNTRYEVQRIEDGTEIKPQIIYLAPADKDVSLLNGVLHLTQSAGHTGLRLPIDAFLRSLARDGAEKALCIILSGTGSDGTLGLKEIKAAGGMAMAQEPDQAKYDDMPRNAIDTGMVDFVLPIEKMGDQLAQYMRHPLIKRSAPPEAGEAEKKIETQFEKIFTLIVRETRHDFSHYKRNTVRRRIARRMAVHQIQDLGQYIELLQESSEEVNVLSREMLITVTNFFRDPNAFEALKEQVLRPLVEKRPGDSAIRVWVAGCATGEEAYTIAILLQELMNETRRRLPVQIFATDLDEESILIARRGQYPKSIAADVSQTRLRQFFIEESNHYRVKNAIREMLVFAKHNLIKDPPFSKLDLVTCRNVLIYMDNTLQRRVIPIFHYTISPGGYLFLGESESIGTFSDLFSPLDSKHKIFRRKSVQTSLDTEQGIGFYPPPRPGQKGAKVKPQKPDYDPARIAEHVILRDYSLPCVLVDREYDVVYFNGDTSAYLSQPGGPPTFNITHMARPEIHHRLDMLLKRAFHEKHMAMERDIQVRINDRYQDVDIVVRPISERGLGENLALVVFKSRPRDEKAGENGAAFVNAPEQEKDVRIRELEQDLQSTKEYLQTTIEELETSNEELKSSNEELQSTNEELQSTNEELDTSREELQSTNEELRTVNSEHQMKIEELSEAYDDLNNLLGATEVATLFLDTELRIHRFTSAACKLFRLRDRDIGRPLSDIVSSVETGDLADSVRTVLEKLTRIEREVRLEDGTWYQMKVVPYRTAENIIGGAIVTYVDITELKHVSEFSEALVETVREPLLVLDGGLRVTAANPAFYRHFQTKPDWTIGLLVYELGSGQWDIPGLRTLLEQIVPDNARFEEFRVEHEFPNIGRRTVLLNARQTTHKGEATGQILLAFEDVTERERSSKEKGTSGKE